MGFHMAGFDVEGFDIQPQRNYPFRFHLGDALLLNPRKLRQRFDAIALSPPCLGYTMLHHRHRHKEYERLIPLARELAEATGLPYIIENVEGAASELIEPIRLCGSSFGLRVRRHRLFEVNFAELIPPRCDHSWQDRDKVYELIVMPSRGGTRMVGSVPVHGTNQLRNMDNHFAAAVAMGIDWMTKPELNQAIPPVYTYWLGRQLMRNL